MSKMAENESNCSNKDLKEYFTKIIKDFLTDILGTFPELKDNLTEEEIHILSTDLSEIDIEKVNVIYKYCQELYPQNFFNILYQSDKIFLDNSFNHHFLPNIDFNELWVQELTENTRNIIWKYLQLILFTISRDLNNESSFGDTAKLFEAIDENELSKKLEESMKEMSEMFDLSNNIFNDLSSNSELPEADDIKQHLSSILDGKLGRLASEIADETTQDLNINEESNASEVFEGLFKNPAKLMGMVKKVGSKLDEKIKSGELKEGELMKEASDIMDKMKNMPGMKNMDKMLKKMGMNMGGGKVNMNAMKSSMNMNLKKTAQRDRMLKKLEQRRLEREMKKKEIEKEMDSKKEYNFSVYNPSEGNGLEKTAVKKRKKKKKRKNKNKNKK
jgi:hypothetical protein